MLRLTLRTLLAWLDGVLSADEADAFAAKLSASGSARVLVDRIRAVVAHPGLDSPKVVGKGLGADANTVAEYLTNSLPAEAVAAFEMVCIESDVHLAEVASCHRTLVEARNSPRVFEPPEPHELERLLAATGGLASGAIGSERSKAKPAAASPAAPSSRAASPAASLPKTPSPAAASTTMKGSKTSPVAWASLIAAVLLLGALAGTLAWRLMPNETGGAVPKNKDAVALRESPAPAPVPPAPADPAVEAIPVVSPEPEPSLPAKENAGPKQDLKRDDALVSPPPRETDASVAAVGAEPAPEPAPDAPQPSAGRVPGGDALAIGATIRPPATIPKQPAPNDPKPADPARKESGPATLPARNDGSAFAIVGVAPLFLQRIGDAGGPADWKVVAPQSPLSASTDLLVPEGFFPTWAVGKATIRVIGPARVVVRPRKDAAAEIELVFGRAIVGGIEAGRPIAFVAGDLSGRLDAGDPIGLEVRFDRPFGSDPEAVPSAAVGSIAFPEGGRLTFEPGAAVAVEDGLIRPDGSVATGVVVTGRGEASRGLPDWLASPSAPRLLDRLAAEAVARSLATAPTPEALERLLGDNRLENRSAAAATLAVMGRYEPLADLLAEEQQGLRLPARAWEALEQSTVPLALARGPTSAGSLLAAFESVVPPNDRDLVRRLVVGLSGQSLAEGGDAVLVAALEHPVLLVRRLAASRLLGAVRPAAADRLRYRPDGPPAARAEAVKWWRSQLEKGRIRGGAEGGLSNAEGE